METKLVWITPDADQQIAYMARVSNPKAAPGDPADKLINYLILHKHWSPFEMACACVEINTTRDIAHQILRHRSFHFQEFSQRYSEAPEELVYSDARLQDTKNRQNSIKLNPDIPEHLAIGGYWDEIQEEQWEHTWQRYQEALKLGIAKELARKLLPEGLTRTKMFMNGTIRDWLHYLAVRTGNETQLEHRNVAKSIENILAGVCPQVFAAARSAGLLATD